MDAATLAAFFTAHAGELFKDVTSIVGLFALIASVTPNKTDDKVWQAVLDGINFLGANFGKAKNAV